MTGTTRIPAAEITGFKGALIKRLAKKSLGQVPTSLGVYWHNQQVLMSMAGLGGKVQKWDACDKQLKSFAHMAVAAQVGCSWCLDFNYFEANNLHLDLAKAREIPRWRESDAFTPVERTSAARSASCRASRNRCAFSIAGPARCARCSSSSPNTASIRRRWKTSPKPRG